MSMTWKEIEAAVNSGTSQSEIARQTGLSQSWISRKLRNMNGVPYKDMDIIQARKARQKEERDAERVRGADNTGSQSE